MRYLGLAIVLLLGTADAAPAQSPSTGAPPLTFFGLRAGIPLSATAEQIRILGGTVLACRSSRADPSVSDCRAQVRDPSRPDGHALDIWLSAIDSLVAVMTVSGGVAPEQLSLWREALQSAFGLPPSEGGDMQTMLQWIRYRQMLRLTWRGDDDGTVASVSLVDGPILDGWGRRRAEQRGAQGLP